MEERIVDVLKRVFHLENVSKDITQSNCAQWGSMNHLILIVELETEFNCSFEPEEIAQIKSFQDIKEVLLLKGI